MKFGTFAGLEATQNGALDQTLITSQSIGDWLRHVTAKHNQRVSEYCKNKLKCFGPEELLSDALASQNTTTEGLINEALRQEK